MKTDKKQEIRKSGKELTPYDYADRRQKMPRKQREMIDITSPTQDG
jgi:hypothetical protein